MAFVCRDHPDAVLVAFSGVEDAGVQEDIELYDAYRVGGAPSAVIVSTSGSIASSLAQGPSAIEALVRLTLRRDGTLAVGTGAVGTGHTTLVQRAAQLTDDPKASGHSTGHAAVTWL